MITLQWLLKVPLCLSSRDWVIRICGGHLETDKATWRGIGRVVTNGYNVWSINFHCKRKRLMLYLEWGSQTCTGWSVSIAEFSNCLFWQLNMGRDKIVGEPDMWISLIAWFIQNDRTAGKQINKSWFFLNETSISLSGPMIKLQCISCLALYVNTSV